MIKKIRRYKKLKKYRRDTVNLSNSFKSSNKILYREYLQNLINNINRVSSQMLLNIYTITTYKYILADNILERTPVR